MSLTEEQITAKNFQEFYSKIRPYLNGSFPTPIVNKFSKGDLYSTDEKIIGQWIDGKPLYQKSYSFNTESIGSGATNVTIAQLDSSIQIKQIDGIVPWNSGNNGGINGINVIAPGSINDGARVFTVDNNTLKLQASGTWFSNQTAVVTIRYTKTTDSPISIGDGNDYSTDEQVVGTWIDGKPVYQRTFVASGSLALARAAWTDATTYFGVDVTVVGKIIDATLLNQDGTVNGMRIPLHFDLYQNKFQIYYDGSIQDTIVNAVLTLKYTKTND